MPIDDLLSMLPSKKSLPLIIDVKSGEKKGIEYCGEEYAKKVEYLVLNIKDECFCFFVC
jgi:hypothetical protein